jgi:hypothetical protein
MNGGENLHELPGTAIFDLLFATIVLVLIGVLSIRRWAGQVVPDYSSCDPQQILADQRFRVGLGLVLGVAWTSIAIALLRHALQSGVMPLLASHFGPLAIPQWLALVLQDGHRLGLTYALWASGL